jgi:hypothetical protein
MKIKPIFTGSRAGRSRSGFLQIDLAIGLIILAVAIVPLGDSFIRERRALRMEYDRSLANEIVDGEMEILAAGAAANLPDGTQVYPVHSPALASLPPGHFQLTKNARHLRLEWIPDAPHHVSIVTREITLP